MLILKNIVIRDVRLTSVAENEGIEGGVLTIFTEGLLAHLLTDQRIAVAHIEIAKPGERTRILPVKDVIEPRAKEEGELFPGVDGELREAGSGTTICLKGCAVVTTGSIVGFQEGIIDMSGPLVRYTPFSRLQNIVLVIEKRSGVTPHEHEEVIRLAGIKAAQYIGKLGRGAEADEVKQLDWKSIPEKTLAQSALPRVAYVYLCMAQGLLHNTYFYGRDARSLSPALISPLEVMDGALVSGNCVSPGSKNTTYHHQNNAALAELMRRDGKEINLMGIILSPLSTVLSEKYRNALSAVKFASFLGAQGALVTQEGFGNPTTDLMLICRELEEKGIRTVLISNEDAGVDGYSESLPDGTKEADAIVSTGNSNQTVKLPAMDRVIGDLRAIERVTGGFVGSIQEDGSLLVEVHGIMGSHNLLGDTFLSAVSR